MNAVVREFPGLATRFLRALPVQHHRDVLSTIDEALIAICPLVRPLVVEVTYVVMDLDLGLPAPDADLGAPEFQPTWS